MIPRLIKRDPAWQMALILSVAIGIAAPLFSADPDRVNNLMFLLAVAIGASLQKGPHVHCTLFEAALPIAGRHLTAARVLSLLALVWLPVLCGAGAILLVKPGGPRVLVLMTGAAILTPAILLPQALRPRRLAGPAWVRFGPALLLPVGFLTWHFPTPGVVMAVCALASGAILTAIWRAVPPAFQVGPLEAEDPVALPESAPDLAVTRIAFAWLPVVRSTLWGFPAMFFSLMVVMGMSGTWFSFFAIFAVQTIVYARQRTLWLYALPLSYRALLAIVLGSSVLPLVAAVAIGMCIPFAIDTSITSGPGPRSQGRPNPPLEFWRAAPGGAVPMIQAPWGETAQPATFSAFGFTFYNPYSTGPGNTPQWRDWQWERATQAVYGRPISHAAFGAAHGQGLKPLASRPVARILALEGVLLFGLILAFATELPKGRLFRRLAPNARVYLAMALFGLPTAAVYGIDIYYLERHSALLTGALFHVAVTRLTAALPNPLLAVGLAAVPVLAMYSLLERQFRQSEVGAWKPPCQFPR